MRAYSFKFVVLWVVFLATSGCIHLVKFSGQATEFNIQVADAQNKTLLLNVVRAAHRFPMHFTELSTLSGTGTLTVGGTVTIPAGILNGGMGTGSMAPTGSITETPTFNVAVLETQEFYQGMLKPVTVDQISTYIDEGLQPEIVFALAFGEILYQSPPNAQPFKFENNFHEMHVKDGEHLTPEASACFGTRLPAFTPDGKVSEYQCFQLILRALLTRRLTTEPVKSVTNLGPLLSQDPFKDLKWLNGFDPKVIKITAVEADDCKDTPEKGLSDSCPEGLKGLPPEQQDALNKGLRLYRLQKETSEFRFCFDQPLEKPRKGEAKYPDLPSKIEHANIPPQLLCHNRLPKDYRPPKDKKTDSHFALALFDASTTDDPFTVQVEPRSTEGVIYYLGEIGRCEMKLDSTAACVTPTILATSRPPGSPEDVLFTLKRGEASRPSLNETDSDSVVVSWGKYRYSVPIDASARDRSGQVLRVVTQLVALNRSAKDFPAPAVLPIITR